MIGIARVSTIALAAFMLAICLPHSDTAWAQTPQAAAKAEVNPEVVADDAVPGNVKSKLGCRTPAGAVTVRSFAGGYVFAQPCETGGQPADRLVFAADRTGKDARLLRFHRPEGRRVQALGNVAYLNGGTEISGNVGRLTRRICRAEGRWRMEGKTPEPGLLYWRQTADCDGKTGWQLIVNRGR